MILFPEGLVNVLDFMKLILQKIYDFSIFLILSNKVNQSCSQDLKLLSLAPPYPIDNVWEDKLMNSLSFFFIFYLFHSSKWLFNLQVEVFAIIQ